MLNAGGLIKLHYHANIDLLNNLGDIQGTIYYRGSPLYMNLDISTRPHNGLVKYLDGLFVDHALLDRFQYHDNALYFDDVIVSQEYTDEIITNMVSDLWSSDPYLEIGKIDLSYWLKRTFASEKVLAYTNTSDTDMNIRINNPEYQLLSLFYNNETVTNNANKILITLASDTAIQIREANGNDLNNITVNCI